MTRRAWRTLQLPGQLQHADLGAEDFLFPSHGELLWFLLHSTVRFSLGYFTSTLRSATAHRYFSNLLKLVPTLSYGAGDDQSWLVFTSHSLLHDLQLVNLALPSHSFLPGLQISESLRFFLETSQRIGPFQHMLNSS